MPGTWSLLEVEAVTADYVSMLQLELLHEPFSKTQHRRALAKTLNHRTEGSIELKHQNISAIMIELGYPFIAGYKPMKNYQGLLREVVSNRVASDTQLASIVARHVAESAKVPTVYDILSRLEAPPKGSPMTYKRVKSEDVPKVPLPPVNYLERESQNRSLGRAGEEFVVNFERARLIHHGKSDLAEKIDHVALTKGDGAGYDIHSFETNGAKRLIEVKTTRYGKQTPFFVSKNEVSVSRSAGLRYHLYRVFEFQDEPRLYSLPGELDKVCWLDPVSFSARIR